MHGNTAKHMWRHRLLLLLLFVVCFGGTYLLLMDQVDPGLGTPEIPDRPRAGEEGSPPGPITPARPEEERGGSGAAETGPEEASAGASSEDPDRPGAIEGRILGADGLPVAEVGVDLRPGQGQVVQRAQGALRIENVPPGDYTLTVWAPGHVPASRSPVSVKPGRTTSLRFTLNKGVRPAGLVFGEMDHRGVPGALVEFANGARARTDANGRFELRSTLPPDALERITVSKEGWDILTYLKPRIPDPREIKLAMTRGDCLVLGRIKNLTMRTTPDIFRVRLFLNRGASAPPQLRRERAFKPSDTFRFEDVHYGHYILTLSFPGSDWATRRREFSMQPGEQVHLDISMGRGSDLTGRLVSDARSNLATKLELLFDDGMKAATVHAAADGSFRFASLAPGSYKLRVWSGRPCFDIGPLETSASEDQELLIDLDRQTLLDS